MSYLVTSYKTARCVQHRAMIRCATEQESQRIIRELHEAGHKFVSVKLEVDDNR